MQNSKLIDTPLLKFLQDLHIIVNNQVSFFGGHTVYELHHI